MFFYETFLLLLLTKFLYEIIICLIFHQMNLFFLTKYKCSSFWLKEIVNSVL